MFKLKKSYRFPRPNFSLVWHLQHSFFSPHSIQFAAIPEVVDGALYTEIQKKRSYSCSYKKVLWKYATNLEDNTHAKVLIQ